MVIPRNSRNLTARLKELGVDVTYKEYHNMAHIGIVLGLAVGGAALVGFGEIVVHGSNFKLPPGSTIEYVKIAPADPNAVPGPFVPK